MHTLRRSAAACALLASACVDYEVVRKQDVESFRQPVREGGVDILWVVDSSFSMDEEQVQLASHAATFITFLSTAPVDFQLGVTTTDEAAGGALIGPQLGRDTPDLTAAFVAQVTSIGDGDRTEVGFLTAVAAAQSGQLRPKADLEVVFFTDEDDQSGLSPGAFVQALDAAHPDAKVVVNAITGDLPDGCASIAAAADPAPRYVDAQEQTGGLRESICSYDYDAMLERMALKVLGLEVRFALAKLPELATMEVRVDGALVHRRDRHGWRYDAGDNSIVFDGYAVPPPGSGIEVAYYEWAGRSTREIADTGVSE